MQTPVTRVTGVEAVWPIALLSRRENHDHLPPFEARLHLDLGHFRCVFLDAIEKLRAEFLMRHLATAEAQRHLDLVALLEESLHRAQFYLVIMIVDHGPVLQLLDLDDLLLFARLGGFLLFLIFVFAVVEDLDDRRRGVGRDLDQVDSGFLRGGKRVRNGHGAFVGAVSVDQMDFADANLLVDPWAVLAGGFWCSHRATNGSRLLLLLRRSNTVTRKPAIGPGLRQITHRRRERSVQSALKSTPNHT